MNDNQLLRYSRHILLPEVDVEGQERLLNARVLIVGLGGLGAPVAMYLAASGVGELWLADHDEVDLSNLQRQIVHTTERVGESKVRSAAAALQALNPDVKLVPIEEKLSGESLIARVREADLVIDATDNFSVRYAINEACVATRTPLVSGAAIRLEGQVTVFDSRRDDSPCYRCLYDVNEDEQLNCASSGVLAPLVGVIGSMQALEAVKLLAGVGSSLAGRLLLFDATTSQWRELKLPRDPDCPVCYPKNACFNS
ncbi:molybdopterin-synthase adenylyltransferase MoeB [Marinimicrobium sp. C6131]|uniref:HesA/MoeB/ThiF family protein n=1 Tax=Marinimicrobium sp. C6131 TaxID=3022676 RepID=UPI00223D95CA|nr:molybdopterin-synthase adenylyltransferase MoeB [Marinimicrobium sp. C6131]UZJ46235.1 molybdopterin-synthase adenylyltransferase MoeB [Marinimicrobium sp. C6131]